MTSPQQLQQARAGQATAIAALLNAALANQNMTAQVQRCGDELQILLDASQLPEQATTVEFIRQGLQRLNITSVTTVTLMAQKRADRRAYWQVVFDLDGSGIRPITEDQALSQRPSHRTGLLDTIPQAPQPPSQGAEIQASELTGPQQSDLSQPPPQAAPHHPPHDLKREPISHARATAPSRTPVADYLLAASSDRNRAAAHQGLLQPLGWGLGLGCVISYLKVTAFLLHPMITLVHELGHAVAAWLLGYPAIPAFDFVHGGGVTAHFSRAPILIYLVYIGLGVLYYRYRKNYVTLRLLLGMTIVYSMLTFWSVHEDVITVMGHGFELLFVVIFGLQGLTGIGCRYGKLEQTLYFMVAFYMWFTCLNFGWKLITDTTFQASYLAGKGGLVNDFVILAGHYAGGNLGAIAIVFLLAALAVPLLTWGIYCNRDRIAAAIHRLWIVTDAPRFSW